MGNVTLKELILKIKELELEPVTVFKLISKMGKRGKGRVETSKEILRGSWVYDLAYQVYHRVGTDHDKKITNRMVIRNYVKTEHYQKCYKLFLQKEWDQLPSIQKSKFKTAIDKQRALVETHTSNCQKLLLSPLGKELLAFLIISGGSMLEVPGTKTEYLKNIQDGLKKINLSEFAKELEHNKSKEFLNTPFLKSIGFKIDIKGNIIKN